MRSVDVLETLELLGSGQWGLVTAAQAEDAGVHRVWLGRLADHGTLHRVRHGVYALPSAEHGPLQDLRAAWLAAEPKKSAAERAHSANPLVVSGAAAAVVHQLGDLVAVSYDFSTPTRKQSSQGDLRFRKRELRPDEVEVVDGLPVTTVTCTVADLARSHTDFDHLAAVVRDALDKPDVTATALTEVLSPYVDRFGSPSGRSLLARMTAGGNQTARAADLLRHVGVTFPESTLKQLQENASRALVPLVEQLNLQMKMPRETLAALTAAMNTATRSALGEQLQVMFESVSPNGKELTRGAQPS